MCKPRTCEVAVASGHRTPDLAGEYPAVTRPPSLGVVQPSRFPPGERKCSGVAFSRGRPSSTQS